MRQDTARNLKFFAIAIFIPLAIGGLSALLTSGNMQIYSEVQTPPLSPPAILFPIVISIFSILLFTNVLFLVTWPPEQLAFVVFPCSWSYHIRQNLKITWNNS